MNVFILDRNMEKSAQMLDDAHLKAQINEACQILMANYNHKLFPESKIGHVSHPVTIFYKSQSCTIELFNYLSTLLEEYSSRFGKDHQNYFWWIGFSGVVYGEKRIHKIQKFTFSKTYVNGTMTDDIEAIRKYISTKPHTLPLTWTNRDKPNWWEV